MAATRDESNARGEVLGAARNSLQPDRFRNARQNDSPVAAIDDLRIGPAGWAYKDWNGVGYPSPLRIEQAEQWIERVAANPRFLFTAKLWQRFTHDPAPSVTDEREVRLGFDVLMGEGKLGAVLVQFPFAFHRTSETVKHLEGLLRRFAQYPLVVEFRHASWKAPET